MNTVNHKSEDVARTPFRILKIGHCPSVSGKSTLTYHIGCDADGDIHIRIHANSASGMFSQEWVAWSAIEDTLNNHVTGFTSAAFRSLIQGKSQNNAGFLLAVLLQEQLVIKEGDQKRSYTCLDTRNFLDQINSLMASNVSLQADDNPTNTKPESPKSNTPKSNTPTPENPKSHNTKSQKSNPINSKTTALKK